ncbi:LysR family transcriptional regulator [Vibrio sp.]|uniref:LysR family transcriptional regulator n=1 Tax=Vibrio sp. TaxID=678 RepID=UPI00379C4FC6
MDLSKFDLNLLKTLAVLLKVQNTNKAAEILGTSQPAVSRSLAKIRKEIGDQLFIRQSKGFTLTPKAEELASVLPRLLDELKVSLQSSDFQPSELTGTFKIALNSFIMETHGYKICQALSKQAPNLLIELHSYSVTTPTQLLTGELDFAINFFPVDVSKQLRQVKVGQYSFNGLCRKNHRLRGAHLSLKEFVELDLLGLIVPEFNTDSMLINRLHSFRSAVNPRMRSQNITPLLNEVKNSDAVLICPESILDSLNSDDYDLIFLEEKSFANKLDLGLIYNSRFLKTERFNWIESLIDDVLPPKMIKKNLTA